MFNTVLFDLDGTLADTALDLTDALNYVLKSENKPPLSYLEVRPHAAYGSADLINLGFGNAATNGLKQKLLAYYQDNLAVKTRLFPQISQVLTALKQRHINFGVVTNKPKRFTEPLLKALAVETPCIISGDSLNNSKPHPEPLLTACEIFNVKPTQALFVGDSSIDIRAANAAKMPIIFAQYGYLPEDFKIDDWQVYATINNPIEILEYLHD